MLYLSIFVLYLGAYSPEVWSSRYLTLDLATPVNFNSIWVTSNFSLPQAILPERKKGQHGIQHRITAQCALIVWCRGTASRECTRTFRSSCRMYLGRCITPKAATEKYDGGWRLVAMITWSNGNRAKHDDDKNVPATKKMASAIAEDPQLGSATEDLSDCRTTRHLLEEWETIRYWIYVLHKWRWMACRAAPYSTCNLCGKAADSNTEKRNALKSSLAGSPRRWFQPRLRALRTSGETAAAMYQLTTTASFPCPSLSLLTSLLRVWTQTGTVVATW